MKTTFEEFIKKMEERDQAIMDMLTGIESKIGTIPDPTPDDGDPEPTPENADQAFLDWMNGKEDETK